MRFNIAIPVEFLNQFKQKCEDEGVKCTDVARMLLIQFTEGTIILNEDIKPMNECNSRFNLSLANTDLINFKQKCEEEGLKATDVARLLLYKFGYGILPVEDKVPKYWGACSN